MCVTMCVDTNCYTNQPPYAVGVCDHGEEAGGAGDGAEGLAGAISGSSTRRQLQTLF